MFSIFASKHVKQGRQFVKDARKLLAFKRDLWSAAQIEEFEGGIARLEAACGEGDKGAIEAAAGDLDKLCGKNLPTVEDAGWRENCEVFLVAIVVALGVRTYFLQPFTIPTGSMQPTLNGIIGHPTKDEPPNFAVQLAQAALLGRTWLNVVAEEPGGVAKMEEVSRYYFFTYTEVVVAPLIETPDGLREAPGPAKTYTIHAPAKTLQDGFGLYPGKLLKKGEPLARGHVDTGDHVFVDKFTYHFRTPRREDVFVFNTESIAKMGNPGPPPRQPSQFYIKRLVGTPGDALRVAPPELFINGERAKGAGFERVMASKGEYRGYSNVAEQVALNGEVRHWPMSFLNSPEATVTVPEKRYWAMGDNSYHSSDSRDWGPVPQENIMGRGVFVYWPFASHWGLIR
jgi:signal peptidase I